MVDVLVLRILHPDMLEYGLPINLNIPLEARLHCHPYPSTQSYPAQNTQSAPGMASPGIEERDQL